MTADEAKAYAKKRLAAFGWPDSEFDSLEKLLEKESNWDYKKKIAKLGHLEYHN